MTELAELERRIVSALSRIGAGLDRLQEQAAQATAPEVTAEVAAAPPVEAPDTETQPAESREDAAAGAAAAEIASLTAALEVERATVQQLTERVRALKAREGRHEAQAEARIQQLTKQLDVQGLELHRLRKGTIQLREALRVLREGQEAGTVDSAMINKAMMAELEALRAARSSETAELDEIIAELVLLVGEEKADA
ncbi:hypothetical protein [Gemmobacter caeruleus]|uniref:hypothetical protein n=1 Tax=Gemmobacter caeruleus TaxID=2595004 RepID=UPI0011EEF5B5|nr:hypothetical protein [Gemmobacter caeruleus]